MNIVGICLVSEKPEHTRNYFGSLADIAGHALRVLERNSQGDCLCLAPKSEYIVDVDHRDVAKFAGRETPGRSYALFTKP